MPLKIEEEEEEEERFEQKFKIFDGLMTTYDAFDVNVKKPELKNTHSKSRM